MQQLNWCVFSRAPECAPLKSKMIYASSKDAIKKKFQGENPELNCFEMVMFCWHIQRVSLMNINLFVVHHGDDEINTIRIVT